MTDRVGQSVWRREWRILRLHGVRAYLPMLWHYWRFKNLTRYNATRWEDA